MTAHRALNRSRSLAFAAVALASALSSGCLGTSNPEETHYYFGDVYDGVTGHQLTGYNIELEYFGRRYAGAVDASGGFSLPAVPAYNDFAVYIDAPGYRPFVTHQRQFSNAVEADRSFHFEAFLFANSLTVADVPVTITLSDSASLPNGSIRLAPTQSSSAYENLNDQSATPPAFMIAGTSDPPKQVWANDDDLLTTTVWMDFKAGAVTIPGKSLVYGVTYGLSILNVPGYQLQQGTATTPLAFEAGVDGRRAFVLDPLTTTPLAVSYVSTDDGNPSKDGTLTIVFNQPVEFNPLVNVGGMREAVDDAFSIQAEDTNNNGTIDTLNDNVSPNLQERGTSFSLSGQQLVFTWDKTRGLRTFDPGDNIFSVTYGGLDSISLRAAGGSPSTVVSLSSLLKGGATSVDVPLSL